MSLPRFASTKAPTARTLGVLVVHCDHEGQPRRRRLVRLWSYLRAL